MSHYAEIENNIVIRVLKSNYAFIQNMPGEWLKTSYNTNKGVHARGNIPLRKNFAGVGYKYDRVRNAFIPPKLYESWILNETTCNWEAPKMKPDESNEYIWNEGILEWEIMQK